MKNRTSSLPAFAYAWQTQWQAVEIAGPDARDFLHRLTTIDFRNFTTGRYSPGAFLQHTGKPIAYFKAVAVAADRFLLFTPANNTEVADAFEKIHFAENLKITPLKDSFYYARLFGTDAQKIQSLKLPDEAVLFDENLWTKSPWADAKLSFDFGLVVPVTLKNKVEVTLKENGATLSNETDFFRIANGEPTWPSELNANTLFTESDFDEAVHDNKGCYPGQEVVERIRSMGQSPKHLLLVRGKTSEAPTAGQPLLTSKGETAGLLSSVTTHGSDWVGLALIKKMYATPGHSFKAGDDTELLESSLRTRS